MRALLIPLAAPLAALLATCACGCSAHHDEHAHDDEHGDEHGERASSVTLSASALARADIRVDEAASGPFAGAIEVPAEVELDPDRVVHVASLVSGRVEEVRATVGQRVSEGDVLAVLRSAQLGDARAALAEARAELAVAEAAQARQRELADAGIGARRALVEAEGALRTARARVAGLRDRAGVYGRGGAGAVTYLRSSIAGEVVERHATVGEVVDANATLFVVADASVVWIAGRASPEDAGALAVGAAAQLTVRGLPERAWSGALAWVAPVLDEHTRTLPIRVVLANDEDGALRPGLFGTLRVARPGSAPSITVAADAVQRLDERTIVFVPGELVPGAAAPGAGEATFHVRDVTVGRTAAGRAEIVDGLEAGERYVAGGAFVLKSRLLRDELEGHEH